jgi:ABC-type multidrug transport system ATPase subunit
MQTLIARVEPTSGRAMVEARGLVKRYGDVVALAGLDLTVPEGTVLGLLGPNGAGKTTAVSILTTLLMADAGHAIVAGHDVATSPSPGNARTVRVAAAAAPCSTPWPGS